MRPLSPHGHGRIPQAHGPTWFQPWLCVSGPCRLRSTFYGALRSAALPMPARTMSLPWRRRLPRERGVTVAGRFVTDEFFDWCQRIAHERGLGDTFDRLAELAVVRGPECRTHDGRPNWCDVHGTLRHVEPQPEELPAEGKAM